MPYGASAQAALLKWVNTFPLRQAAGSLDDLVDGHILAEVLHDMDPQFDPAEMESNTGPSTWLNNKRNLQVVLRGLARFIHRTHPEMDVLANFHSLADRPDVDAIGQIISSMLAMALMATPENEKYVPVAQSRLDTRSLAEIMAIISQKQSEVQSAREEADVDDRIHRALEMQDSDLVAEERLASLQGEINNLSKRLADKVTRLEHLQLSYEEVVDKNQRLEYDLELMKKMRQDGASDSQIIKALEDKIREQDDLIASQESQAEDDRLVRARLQREVESLKPRALQADDLEAENRKLRQENETATKQAKRAERYGQKLERQREIETENQNLQWEKEQLQDQLKDYEKIKGEVQQLEATIQRYQDRLQRYELERFEISQQKSVLEEEIMTLRHELKLLQARSAADENVIAELNDQLKTGGDSVAATPGAGQTTFNLEQELSGASSTTQGPPNLELEMTRLRAENALLKSTMASGGDNARLREELDQSHRARERLQENFSDIFAEHALAQEQINTLLSNQPEEGNRVIGDMRTRIMENGAELKKERRRLEDLQMQLADRDRELLVARTSLAAVEKDGVSALEDLKAAHGLVSTSLREELEVERGQNRTLKVDLEQQRVQLIDALLAKDKLRRDLDELREQQDGVAKTETAGDAQALVNGDEEAGKKTAEKLEKMRIRLRQLKEQNEKKDQENRALARKIKAMEDGSAFSEQKAQSDKIIRNLQRENALISSAWYDLTSRMQSNHVVLQRRHDTPKSWLNKQRQMVNATPRR